jgi:CDP-diacylglycerol pyrophosphatase
MGLARLPLRGMSRAFMAAFAAALILNGATATGQEASAPQLNLDGTPVGHRDKLREITHTECVPHWLATKDPSPCVSLTLTHPEPGLRGFCVLPDRKGRAHLLLIPLEPVSGIESPDAWQEDRPNYFEYAWERRATVAQLAGRELPRQAIGLAINSKRTRSQDQLHIHMSCINLDVHDQLMANADAISTDWTPLTIRGTRYQAQRVMGSDLGRINPFTRLVKGVPGARQSMDAYTMLVTAMTFKEGAGFVLLAGGEGTPGAELLLDPGCAIAR